MIEKKKKKEKKEKSNYTVEDLVKKFNKEASRSKNKK